MAARAGPSLLLLLLAAAAVGAGSSSALSDLQALTTEAGTMQQNADTLLQSYCPVCDENPGKAIGLSTIGGLLFVTVVGVCVGTDVTLESFALVFSTSKRAFVVGLVSQFVFMPLFCFVVTFVFQDDLTSTAFYSYEAAVLGVMIVGCLPGGNTSNMFTWFVGGNVSLSILMSLVSNVAACFMIPLLLIVYYDMRFEGTTAPGVPYQDLFVPLGLSLLGIAGGMLIRAKGSADAIWWTAKSSSLFAMFFLVLAIILGVRDHNALFTQGYSFWLVAFLIQPVGYMFGFFFAKLCRCGLRDAMTIAFETGVQNFVLGMVMAELGFNKDQEVCQFDPRCLALIGADLEAYQYVICGDGRLPEGSGPGRITMAGFLPGQAGADLSTGGCCRFNELVFLDVFKFSAVCSLLYAIHSFWQVVFFRKIFPNGFVPKSQEHQAEDDWPDYKRNVVSLASGVCPPVCQPSGPGSEKETPPTTLPQLLDQAAARIGKHWALGQEWPVAECPKDETKHTGTRSGPWSSWNRWTWADFHRDINALARGMIRAGLEPEASVAIWGTNAPQWHISAMAAIVAGAKCAGVYPTDTEEQVIFKVKHSSANLAVVDGAGKTTLLLNRSADLPKLRAVAEYGQAPMSAAEGAAHVGGGDPHGGVRRLTWDALRLEGVPEEPHASRRGLLDPGRPCCLVYTSGTTGMPKAVMLSHDNVVFGCANYARMGDNRFGMNYEQERLLSYLPLSHVAGFLLDICFSIYASATTKAFFTTYFARPYDLKEGTLRNRLTFVRPTVFFGVPRVWEKFQAAIIEAGRRAAAQGGFRAQMPIFCCVRKSTAARWARSQGLITARNGQHHGSKRSATYMALADGLVLSNIRAALGLDCIKLAFTGAAPISVETLEFFGSIGMQLNEVYGMSESTGYATLNAPDRYFWGSCGFAGPGIQVKVYKVDPIRGSKEAECPRAADMFNPTEAEQGEICIRGRCVMMGYLANPELGEEHEQDVGRKNADAIDADGWLHTGDMGCMAANGHVRITGRFKELIITAGGENVAPVPMEDHVKQLCAAVSNAMMIGDTRKYNTMLVTLVCEDDGETLAKAAQLVPGVQTVRQAMASAEYRACIDRAVKAANANSAVCPSNASKVQKFEILPADFSMERDELTPTLKIKRKVIARKYADLIEGMYA